MKNTLTYIKNPLEQKKSRLDSLLWEGIFVILVNMLCVIVLTPIYQGLGQAAVNMSVDVARDGSFLHILCDVSAAVFFYLSSFLGTAAFFVGASYIVRAAIRGSRERLIASSVILYIGMSVSTLVTLLVFMIIRMGDPTVTLAEPITLLYDVLFLSFRVIAIALAAYFLVRARARVQVISAICATFMFFCAAGLELVENIPFFLRGTILTEDIINLGISMLLYAIHGVIGYIIMVKLIRK